VSEDTPKRYQVTGEYVQIRVGNSLGLGGNGKLWMYRGFNRGAVLPADVHPDDLAHMLTAVQPGIDGGQPLVTEIEGASR